MNNEEANSAYLFPDFFDENAKPKKLKMKSKKTDILGEQEVESIPVPVLPTRWEYLQRKIEDSKVTTSHYYSSCLSSNTNH